jgi:hypothetical protein
MVAIVYLKIVLASAASECPPCPRKRTWLSTVVMSALCQKRKSPSRDAHTVAAGSAKKRLTHKKPKQQCVVYE